MRIFTETQNKIIRGVAMCKNLEPITERKDGNTIIRSFIVGEDRKQTDQRIITDVKRIFSNVKNKSVGSQ